MASPLTLKRLFEFMRKIDELNISSEAKDLLIHYMTHQGESYVFHNDFIADQKGWSRPYFDRIKKELVTEGLITSEYVYENGKRVGTHVTVIYDLPNVTFPNVSKANVRKPNVSNANVRKPNVSGANVSKSNVIESKKINREEENRREGENSESVCAGDFAPPLCERQTHTEMPASSSLPQNLPPDIPPAPVPEPEKKTKFTPPTVADVSQYISEKLREKNISWSPYQISETAESIVDFYTSKGWKVGKDTMKNWRSSVSGWLRNDNWMPKFGQQPQTLPPSQSPGNQQRQPPKSFKQQDLDYANRRFIDPAGEAIKTAVRACLSMGGNDPCDYGLPVQLRERAMKLLQEERQKLAQSFNPFPELPQ